MSELVAMRQRIKAIETIKKVTHAMRLISMSLHARLRTKKGNLDFYKNALVDMFTSIKQSHQTWHHHILEKKSSDTKPLIILIGSQKGLCGSFNNMLFSFIEHELELISYENVHTILVGKKMVDNEQFHKGTISMTFPDFSQGKLLTIAQKISDLIWHAHTPFTSVTIFYNYPKTFFLQKPHKVNLIPFDFQENQQQSGLKEEYYWEQKPELILDFLAHKVVQCSIQDILFESLIAEQAARFVAMDNSTRNAKNLLQTMRLNYNKTRQAKITREITDLVASFQENLGS
ncbi:MAG: F0F1 ATP synthase subunit gamma [Candidatus Babeliales bacterium]